MKMLPVFVTSAVAGVLISAMVFAAPVSDGAEGAGYSPMNRAEAYHLAVAN